MSTNENHVVELSEQELYALAEDVVATLDEAGYEVQVESVEKLAEALADFLESDSEELDEDTFEALLGAAEVLAEAVGTYEGEEISEADLNESVEELLAVFDEAGYDVKAESVEEFLEDVENFLAENEDLDENLVQKVGSLATRAKKAMDTVFNTKANQARELKAQGRFGRRYAKLGKEAQQQSDAAGSEAKGLRGLAASSSNPDSEMSRRRAATDAEAKSDKLAQKASVLRGAAAGTKEAGARGKLDMTGTQLRSFKSRNDPLHQGKRGMIDNIKGNARALGTLTKYAADKVLGKS